MKDQKEINKTQTQNDPWYNDVNLHNQYDPFYYLIRFGESIIFRSKNNLIVRILVCIGLVLVFMLSIGLFHF
jgi:hypothetical protein